VPECDGACPANSICLPNAAGEACSCAPLDEPCVDSTAPQCGGYCPDGEICEDQGMGLCSCEAVPCADSPYPECFGGGCPEGETCQGDGSGGCSCTANEIGCAESAAPECGGLCAVGEVCREDLASGLCRCESVGLGCAESAAPTCAGRCPNVEDQCIADGTGGFCYCAPIADCGSSSAPECGGGCPEGQQCRESAAGDVCECVELPSACADTSAPVCEGFCATGERCFHLPDQDRCECQPCDLVVPGHLITIVWASSDELRWSASECAESYNVYRLENEQLEDLDEDSLADDYGRCLDAGLTDRQTIDASEPDAGRGHWYLVTGENAAGESSLGMNSQLVERPNRDPCP
jgi:hypothetical protein